MKKWTRFVSIFLLGFALLLPVFGEEMKPAAYVSFGGVDVLMNSASVLADKLGQKDAFELWTVMAGDIEGIAKDKPAGIVLLSDGTDTFPFAFFPVPDLTNPNLPTLFSGGTFNAESGTYTLNSRTFGAVMRDGWTFLFPEGEADKLPAGEPTAFIEAEDASRLLAARIYPDRIPSSSIDQFAEWVAQFSKKAAGLDDEENSKSAAQFVEAISVVLKNVKSFSLGIFLDYNTGDFVAAYSGTPLEGSELAEVFPKMKNRQTNWKEVFQPQSSVIAMINNFIVLPSQVEAQRANYKQVFKQLIDAVVDTDDAEEGEKILSQIGDLVDQTIALGKTDYAFQVTNDKLIEFAGTIAGGQNLIELLNSVENVLAKNEEEVADLLKSRKINGKEYKELSVSTFTFSSSLTEDSALTFPDLAGEEISLLIAVKEGAIVAIAGLDQTQIVQRFKKISENIYSESVEPICFQFSLKNLGAYLNALLPTVDGKFAKVISLLKEMDEGAVIRAQSSIEGNSFSGSFVVTGKFLESLGSAFATMTQEEAEEDAK